MQQLPPLDTRVRAAWQTQVAAAVNTPGLLPGDVLGSGTVGRGCILEHGDERWLEVGDEVELEMSRLPDAGLRPEERALLGKVREVLVLLRVQTRELRAYWDKGEKSSADRFHKAREEAGAKLRELLRIGA